MTTLDEEWRPINGTDQYYVNAQGEVINCRWDKIRAVKAIWHSCHQSYMVAIRWDDGTVKKRYLHQLVAQAFVPKQTSRDRWIRFLDGDRRNCRADNLEWIRSIRLTIQDVRAIRQRYWDGAESQRMIADEYGLSIAAISNIINEYTWRGV